MGEIMGRAERRLRQQQKDAEARRHEAFQADRHETHDKMQEALQEEFYVAARNADARLGRKDYDAPGATLFEYGSGLGKRRIAAWQIG
jgi:hypothetical protein